MNHKILFRCDAGDAPEIGTGHIARSKTLAKALISDGLILKKKFCFSQDTIKDLIWDQDTLMEKILNFNLSITTC